MGKIFIFIGLLMIPAFYLAQNWMPVSIGFNNSPYKLFVNYTSDLLIADGVFTTADNIPVHLSAQFDGTGWDSIPYLHNNYMSHVYLDFQGNTYFSSLNLIRWNGVSLDTIGTPNGSIYGVCIYQNELIAYGNFDSIEGVAASCIAKWNGSVWSAFDTTHFRLPYILVAKEYQGQLYIGGNFANWDGSLDRLARWDGTKWNPVGNGIRGGSASVATMVEYQGKLIFAGNFNKSQGNPGNAIVGWDGYNWQEMGNAISEQGATVSDAKVFDNDLYVCGNFNIVDGVSIMNFAKWDGSRWCGLGSTPQSWVGRSMAVYHNELYIICGRTLNGDTMNFITKWVGGSYTDTCGAMVGIENKIPQFNLSLFPNPAHSTFSIFGISPGEISGIRVYDVAGKLVCERVSLQGGTVEGLVSGMYFVEIEIGDQWQVLKLIVE